jgi:hypothetical protein
VQFINDSMMQIAEETLVVCAGSDPETISVCCFLLGSYLIFSRGSTITEVSETFRPISSCFQANEDPSRCISLQDKLTNTDGWRAVSQAKANGWLDFLSDEVDIETCIDMQEYLHYSSPANGVLHVIIPSQLIAFQCPSSLPSLSMESSNHLWVDLLGTRHFAPAFYADILGADYGVGLVVRCDSPAAEEHPPSEARRGYDDSAFHQRGIAVEHLAPHAGEGAPPTGATLRAVDRFLTLARLSPGPVAIHGGAAGLGGGGEVLVSSLLIQRHGFDGRTALAWLRIASPPRPPPELVFSVAAPSSAPQAAPRHEPPPPPLPQARAVRCPSPPAARPHGCPAPRRSVSSDSVGGRGRGGSGGPLRWR